MGISSKCAQVGKDQRPALPWCAPLALPGANQDGQTLPQLWPGRAWGSLGEPGKVLGWHARELTGLHYECACVAGASVTSRVRLPVRPSPVLLNTTLVSALPPGACQTLCMELSPPKLSKLPKLPKLPK